MTISAESGQSTKLLVDHVTNDSWGAKGRRQFLAYRDIGLEAATDGRFRATAMRATGKNEATGWHYHVCDLQFVYVIKGWVELEFEGGEQVRLEAGSALSIPGGTLHNEKNLSEDLEVLEFSSPGDMKTVAVDPPAGA
ncbi:MAG: cupin domain-containing protein [Acidimicrobiales bacterium]